MLLASEQPPHCSTGGSDGCALGLSPSWRPGRGWPISADVPHTRAGVHLRVASALAADRRRRGGRSRGAQRSDPSGTGALPSTSPASRSSSPPLSSFPTTVQRALVRLTGHPPRVAHPVVSSADVSSAALQQRSGPPSAPPIESSTATAQSLRVRTANASPPLLPLAALLCPARSLGMALSSLISCIALPSSPVDDTANQPGRFDRSVQARTRLLLDHVDDVAFDRSAGSSVNSPLSHAIVPSCLRPRRRRSTTTRWR